MSTDSIEVPNEVKNIVPTDEQSPSPESTKAEVFTEITTRSNEEDETKR